MSEDQCIGISEDYVGEEGLISGELRYEKEDGRLYLNVDGFTYAVVCGLKKSDAEEKTGVDEEELTEGLGVELKGKLLTTEPYGGEYFLEVDPEYLKYENKGLDEEKVKELAEYIVPFVGQYEDVENVEGVPLRVLRGNFNEVSSRKIRQAVINRLEAEGGEDKLYRTRVKTYKGREAAVTTGEPSWEIRKELQKLGEFCLEGKWDRIYKYKNQQTIDAPETKYDYQVFSGLPKLFMSHAKRHDEELETWVEDKLSDEERAAFISSLKGVDPESYPREREIRHNLKTSHGKAELEIELILRKRISCTWSVDPLESNKYLEASFGSKGDRRRGKVIERAKKGEELAERAVDMITDEDIDYDTELWKNRFDIYSSYFKKEEVPPAKFGDRREAKMTHLTGDPWLTELDSHVDQMKDEVGNGDSETKRQANKDTKTSWVNFRGPVQEFLEYVEEAVEGRLDSLDQKEE